MKSKGDKVVPVDSADRVSEAKALLRSGLDSPGGFLDRQAGHISLSASFVCRCAECKLKSDYILAILCKWECI